MFRLRAMFFHALCISTGLGAALLAAVPGCGKTTTIGQVVPNSDGGAGGSAAGAAMDGAADTGYGAESGAGNGGSTSGGTSGEAGSAGSTAGSAGAAEDAGPEPCRLPKPAPVTNPSPAEQERTGLIHAFCEALSAQGCIDAFSSTAWISGQAKACSPGERITACEQDVLYSYLGSITPECDDEWQNLIRCATTADYSVDGCAWPLDPAQLGNSPAPARCPGERTALTACQQEHREWETVTGARATCTYGRGNLDPSACWVGCTVGANDFSAECSAPPGLPLFCPCSVNGHYIEDPARPHPYSAGSCREMAQAMADGECVDRLDCCFTWVYQGAETCSCAPTDSLGMPSCEAAAEAAGGKVVDICPQYERGPGACWPPWSCPH